MPLISRPPCTAGNSVNAIDLRGVLDRRVEELTARHIRTAGVDLGFPPGEAEPEICLLADEPYFVSGVEAGGVSRHAVALRVPIQKAGAVEESSNSRDDMPASCARAGVGYWQPTQRISPVKILSIAGR